jgi:2-desacetyl-2-hydroxyethyl bacteriochlorophyllide A dehydrogenase
MTDMRAAVWEGSPGFQITTLPVPDVPEGWALVQVSHVGLCGTDFSILHGQHPRAAAPLILGHEFSGHVVRSTSDGLPPGLLVAGEPLISCGNCWACSHGAAHVCARLGLFGIDAPGALAEFIAVPASKLHPLPDDVTPGLAALTEPLAVAVHAVSKSGLEAGDTVAVYGAGPIGVLTALVARLRGAGRLLICEPSRSRGQTAADLGFEVTADPEEFAALVAEATQGEGAAVVFDCAGHPAVAGQAAAIARVLGTIVIVGVHKQPAAMDLRRLNFAEQRVQGVRVYSSADVRAAVGLVTAGSLPLDRLPVSVFGLDRTMAAFEAAMSGQDALKVMVTP